jgi:predicted membrane channel-forming protein YqfA (hemolysin III family)
MNHATTSSSHNEEREQSPFEELLNSLTHGIGALLSVVGLIFF